jgi:hypothetical protein
MMAPTNRVPQELAPPDLASLPRASLEAMRAAGEEVRECHRVLLKGGLNVSGEVLRGQGQFVKLQHYPKGDVYDRDSHSQYYYHAHRDAEHGHFHTFMRAKGMPAGVTPVPDEAGQNRPQSDEALAHIVAISMDKFGMPIRLFTTNRWVTGETMYPADDVIRMIEGFRIDHANPSWPTNRWITAMLRLFRPQIETLLHARDAILARRRTEITGDVYEDRALETISELPISVDAQLAELARRLA